MTNILDVEPRFWDANTEASHIPNFLRAGRETHYHARLGEDWFLWKYAQSPWGPDIVSYGLAEDGRIAGNVSFGWQRLQAHGKQLLAAVATESFVHPDFQRRGLYTKLLKAAKNRAVNEGADIFIMFPNSASLPAIQKSGLSDVGGTFQLIKPIKPLRLIKQALKGRLKDRAFKPDKFEDRTEEFSIRLEDLLTETTFTPRSANIQTLFDAPYIRWRFAEKPRFRYEVVGTPALWAVIRLGYRVGLREAQIMEAFGGSPRNGRALRRLLKEIVETWEVDLVSYFCTAGNPLRRALHLNGFLPGPNRTNFFVEGCETASLPIDLLDAASWSLSTANLHTY